MDRQIQAGCRFVLVMGEKGEQRADVCCPPLAVEPCEQMQRRRDDVVLFGESGDVLRDESRLAFVNLTVN